MTSEYENLISNLAKEVSYASSEEQRKENVLARLETNIASFISTKDKLQAIFKHDLDKLYGLEQKLKAAKLENSKLFFTKKIEKMRPNVIELVLKLNDVKQSIERLEQHKEKLLKGETE